MSGDVNLTESIRVTVVIWSSAAWNENSALATLKVTSEARTTTNPAQRFLMFDPPLQTGQNQSPTLVYGTPCRPGVNSLTQMV
jgi:hypothetical protein